MFINVMFYRSGVSGILGFVDHQHCRLFNSANRFPKKLLFFCLCFTVVLSISEGCYAQQLVFSPPSGNPSVAFYTGDARWLAEQLEPRSHLHKISSLRKLVLQNHKVSAEEMEYIAKLQQLDEFQLGANPEGVVIDPAAFGSLDKLTSITSLGICKANLQDADMEVVSRLPRIQFLAVDQKSGEPARANALTEKFVNHILKMKNIEHLSIRLEAPWTDDTFAKALSFKNVKYIEVRSRLLTNRSLREIASREGDTQVIVSSPQFTSHQISAIAKRKGTPFLTVNDMVISKEE